MEVTKKTIDLQDSTDTCTVYFIEDNEIDIRITFINDRHYETVRSSK